QALHADWDAALSVQADPGGPSGGTEGVDDMTSNNGDDMKPRHER
ncbi:cytochrome b/b6 domain-containing protein, partial [Acidithiobacillus ferridurans]|nr:cytochrome b/b6 domain-containing protein [Acidithiobacillus ferridurans]